MFLMQEYRKFQDTFKRVQKSGLAAALDEEFESFEIPSMGKRSGIKPTPSNIVLGTDSAIIKLSELARYEEILGQAKKKNRSLRMLDTRMDGINEEIWRRFMDAKIVYRGMEISEFCTISKMGGSVGLHRRLRYAARNDFVSFSIDSRVATIFAIEKEENGLVVEVDVSNMKRSDYAPVTYEARRNVRVTRRGRHTYRPYEMFGGTQAGVSMRECEIHLRNGSKPLIRGIIVPGARPKKFIRRLNMAASRSEASQRRKIRIKYVGR